MRSLNRASVSGASAFVMSTLTQVPVTPHYPLYLKTPHAACPFRKISCSEKYHAQGVVASRYSNDLSRSRSGEWAASPPTLPACGPSRSEKKDGLECRKNRLQLSRDLYGLKSLRLLRVEDGAELREKTLLCLGHLLLQGMNLDDQSSHLGWVSAGVQQIAELLDEGLCSLK